MMRRILLATAASLALANGPAVAQDYEILAARYGVIEGFPLRSLLPDAPRGETLDIAMTVWVVRDDERVVLVDTGFFREAWMERFALRDFERPDRVLRRVGIEPEDVTDVIVTHAHWDHMGGVALFPEATVWIQAEEYAWYTGPAWQEGGSSGGIDPADVLHLVQRTTEGDVRLVGGDGVEILPGIRVHTGARHTYASQYVVVEGPPTFVLASDNAYLYRGIAERRASATFRPDDRAGNLAALDRMVELAGDPARVVPGHDLEVFRRYPGVAEGIVRIRP